MSMSFGVHVGHLGGPIAELRKLWRFADERGFDWFSVSDHFRESPAQDGAGPCFEAIASLAAAAIETSNVRLATGVNCILYRNPGLLAKSLTTIDHFSGGRVECGIGAGWYEEEARAYGYEFPGIGAREDMLEEYAQVLRKLFDPNELRSDFSGNFFSMQAATNAPKPLQDELPLWIGGRGEKRTLRAAAKYASGWNGNYMSPEEWRHKVDVLERWCTELDRDPRTVRRTANVGFYMGADSSGAARAEVKRQEVWQERAATTAGFLCGTANQVIDVVGAFREAGSDRLTITVRDGPYDWAALDSFASDVMPKFNEPRAN
jgi:alkanesulfonate monooxygenase SsuD/methylene tetrahydromethanopterin reductase-like flavin-dependent oxidoreductase (luciferase family)